jgi:homoserine O-acetyltransferase
LLASADFPGSRYHLEEPLPLDSGALLANVTIAYETYGTLNADKSNAILVCHALTGDQYAASSNPITGKTGWWHLAIGEGKPIDTKKYFVICSNVLGSCCGTTGPRDTNPVTGKPYGIDFPTVTIGDMVRAQQWLVTKHLGIEKLFAVVGASMGGGLLAGKSAAGPKRPTFVEPYLFMQERWRVTGHVLGGGVAATELLSCCEHTCA